MKRQLAASKAAANEVDRVWQQLVSLVMENLGDWRHRVSESAGMPFSRTRVLRRLVDTPMTMRQLADAMTTDAPAATVAVNELEAAGLVVRRSHPTNRRAKLVSLTPTGSRLVARLAAITPTAPPAVAALPHADLAALQRILDLLQSSR